MNQIQTIHNKPKNIKKNERVAGLLDPALENNINLGDQIISEAVRSVIKESLGFDRVIRMPTLRSLRRDEVSTLNSCDAIFIGGTNLLNSRMMFNRQWALGLELRNVSPLVLFGVGWWQYEGAPDFATRWLLRRLLSQHGPHSVRDDMTRMQLNGVNIGSVVNTSCPTLWALKSTKIQNLPTIKSPAVVFTLTCYSKKYLLDRKLIDFLFLNYKDVYFWPQGNDDMVYLNNLMSGQSITKFKVLDSSVYSFDLLLSSTNVDYIGTRLHAGIRAIQHGRRSLIISVDNRAIEISRDTGLPCVERDNPDRLSHLVNDGFRTSITLPQKAIDDWCMAHSVMNK